MPLPEDCVRELTALTGVALAYDDLASALDEICRIAVRVVRGAEGASLTTFSESGPSAAAASDEWSLGLDEMQYEEREGPCLDAARTGLVFRVRDIGDEPRWPSYMPRACNQGAQSMVSLPLTVEGKLIGALNIYARTSDAFDGEAVSLAEVVAAHAGLAGQVAATLYRHRDLGDQLREAMASRAVIEQAKGVIMATTGGDAEAAFRTLVQQSQHENRKVREIAEELVRRQRAGHDPG